MKGHKILWVVCLACAMAFAVGACGGGDDEGGGSDSGSGQTKGAKAIDVSSMDNAKGNVTYCAGKDTSGDLKQGIAEFNKANPGLTAKLLEFPEAADEQRNQFIQRQRAKSADCDGFEADVVWTAEFASQKWLLDMTPYVESRKDEFVPSTLSSVDYEGKLWGVPRVTDAGFLYYRKDKNPKVPATWQEVYAKAKAGNGIAYQGAAYEGLTVDFLELAYAAGGKIISDDGKKSVIDSPENLKALQFMVDGIKDGAAPKAVTTYMEEESRRAFESGSVDYVRNWPYIYALGNMKGSKVKGKFDVAPYPAFEGGGKAAILGGHNMVISTYSKNPGGALKLIDYLTSEKRMTKNAADFSKAPVLKASFEDPAARQIMAAPKGIPFLPQLKQSVEQAKSRPVSPVYTQISQAIYKNVNSALSGATDPKSALKKAQTDMDKALATF
jgi:multiple sugar transport system substrate-binding protein